MEREEQEAELREKQRKEERKVSAHAGWDAATSSFKVDSDL